MKSTEKRLSNGLALRLGELEYDIEMSIFKYLKTNKNLSDELYINLEGHQLSVFLDDNNYGGKQVMLRGKSFNSPYEGTNPLRFLSTSKQISVLEQIEDYLNI